MHSMSSVYNKQMGIYAAIRQWRYYRSAVVCFRRHSQIVSVSKSHSDTRGMEPESGLTLQVLRTSTDNIHLVRLNR